MLGLFGCRTLAAGTIVAILSAPASAITIRDDADAGGALGVDAALALGADSLFSSTVIVTDGATICSGSLISSTSIATARHCTDGMNLATLEVRFTEGDGTVNDTVAASAVNTLAPDSADPSNYFDGTDLAVITLASAVTYTPYEVLFWDTIPLSTEVITFAGYGKYGTGTSGASSSVDLQRRAAQNTYDAYNTFTTTEGNTNIMLYADFDDPNDSSTNIIGSDIPLTHEGLIGGGDSGGPMFFYRDGRWVVGGVLTGTFGFDEAADGDYGDVAAWTSFHSQESYDLLFDAGATFYTPTAVPLPASAVLLLGGFGLMAARRKRKAA